MESVIEAENIWELIDLLTTDQDTLGTKLVSAPAGHREAAISRATADIEGYLLWKA